MNEAIRPIRRPQAEVIAVARENLETLGWVGGVLCAHVALGGTTDDMREAKAIVAQLVNEGATVGDGEEPTFNARLRKMQAEGRDVRELAQVGGAK
jgi:hypothetical protein